MTHRIRAVGLAAGLAAGAAGVLAQTDGPGEARLEMGVVVQAVLPEGWQMSTLGRDRIEIGHAASERLILIESPSHTLRDSHPYPGTIHRRPGLLFGAPVTLYRLPPSTYDGPPDMLLALLAQCIRPVTEDQIYSLESYFRQRDGAAGLVAPVLIGFRNPEGVGDFDLGGAFDAVLQGLTLSLPSHLAECPPDLDAPLRATDPPVHEGGWISRQLLGVDLSLPERFVHSFGYAQDGTIEFDFLPIGQAGSPEEVLLTTDAEMIAMIRDELIATGAKLTGTSHPTLPDFTSHVLDIRDEPGDSGIIRIVQARGAEGRFALVLAAEIDPQSDPEAIIAGQDEILRRLAPAGTRPPPGVAVPAEGGRLVLRDAQADVTGFEHAFDSGLVLRATLPAGWAPDAQRREVTLASITPPRRAIAVRADTGAPVIWHSFRGPRYLRRGTLAGHPATLIHGRSAETYVGSMERANRGGLIAMVLDRCLDTGNPINPLVFSVLLYSEAGHAGAVPDPVIAAMLADFELILPEGTIPCPADMLDNVEAVPE